MRWSIMLASQFRVADDVTDAELREQFDTNFFGTVAVTQALLPQMRRQGFGHVLMVTSISGRMGYPGVSSYAASKFALEGWTETLRFEMLPLGIHAVYVVGHDARMTLDDTAPAARGLFERIVVKMSGMDV